MRNAFTWMSLAVFAAFAYFYYVGSNERERLCEIIEDYQLDSGLPVAPRHEIDAICAAEKA